MDGKVKDYTHLLYYNHVRIRLTLSLFEKKVKMRRKKMILLSRM